MLDYQSRDPRIDPPFLLSFGWDFKPRSSLYTASVLVGCYTWVHSLTHFVRVNIKNIRNWWVPYFFGYKTEFFFLPKQSQRSRSILQDGSRSFGLFRKGKIGFIAKFHRTDIVIWSHSRGTKPPSYSQINMVPSCCHATPTFWLL